MRQIVLFQTFANIVLGLAFLFFLLQMDRKLEEISDLQRVSTEAIVENREMRALLEEIAASTRLAAEQKIEATN